jgi:hypothetical protein
MLKQSIVIAALAGLALQAAAQKAPAADSTKKAVPVVPVLPGGVKPYKDVITADAITQRGLLKVHLLKDKFYFEIPDSLLGRDILVVNRIRKSAAGERGGYFAGYMYGYAGDEIGNNVIRFEKGPYNKLFMKSVSYSERSNDTTETGMYRSVLNSNIQPIVASFDVKASAKDSVSKIGSTVIEVTDYLNTDNDIFFFQPYLKRVLSLGPQLNDRSYISEIKAFPTNVEIRTVKSYQKVSASPGAVPGSIPGTYELNSSMVLLPKVPMKARYADARVGFFAAAYTDFDANPQGIKQQAVITRWRLEPKPEDVVKYKRGELVEPAKPIVFYIDPATPKQWVPYLIQGVNDWQKAFEQAGFKNAIMALEAPNDSTWSIDDARHNVIVYKPSAVANASGPHVHDPRSGEIIETHVNWYHNLMKLVHDWYMIQAGAVDPAARKMQFSDSLMGQLIRFVSSHEVGHTLGLMHNFGASSTIPVENLRNKAWVEANGHTPSIMDYARFNYVAQPEDHISEKGIFPRIGEYDRWAIQWGYRWIPEFANADAETPFLNKWIIDSIGKNKHLWFGTERDFFDPRTQNEDLGDNPVLAGNYGIKNLQRIVPNILAWTKEPNEGYDNAKDVYNQLFGQYHQYMLHAVKVVGGKYNTPKAVEEAGTVYEPVPYAKQKEAMAFLNAQLFTTPLWLVNKPISEVTGLDPVPKILSEQAAALRRIMSALTLTRMVYAEALNTGKQYTATDLLADLKKGIWGELYSHSSIDLYRRNLQKNYLFQAIQLVGTSNIISIQELGGSLFAFGIPAPSQTDVSSIGRAHLTGLRNDIKKAIPFASGITLYHLQDLLVQINDGLEPKKQ